MVFFFLGHYNMIKIGPYLFPLPECGKEQTSQSASDL